jgi:hypothetical protein
MALEDLNRNLISFKRLSGKAHTIETFLNNANEVQTSNVSISFSTVFGQSIDPLPVTNGGLTSLYSNDGVVEKVRFEIEPIPFRTVDTDSSQGFRLKLPSDYTANGQLASTFPSGSILYEALGKLQIVPPLYGQLNSSAVNEYDPILYQADGTTVIPALDAINWNLDFYSGILFVQDPIPSTGFDTDPARPTFMDAYLYIGSYLDDVLSGQTGDFITRPEFNLYTGDTETRLQDIETDVLAVSAETLLRIELAEKAQPLGVATLGADGIVPISQLPPELRGLFVVDDIAERDSRFVPSGTTATGSTIESFEGLQVLVLDASADTGVTSGSAVYVDSTGFLDWVRIDSDANFTLDFADVTNKPILAGEVIAGSGIGVVSAATGLETTNYTVSVDTDNTTIGIVSGNSIGVLPQSITEAQLALVGGTGQTGQVLVSTGNGTFDFQDINVSAVTSVVAQSGITNVGTALAPILEVDLVPINSGLEIIASGLQVADGGIGLDKLNTGSTSNQINADVIPINTGSTISIQYDNVGEALEDLRNDIDVNVSSITANTENINNVQTGLTALEAIAVTGATNVGTGEGEVAITGASGVFNNEIRLRNIRAGINVSVENIGNDVVINATGTTGTGGTTIIGPARDGTYLDGVFPFEETTPIGFAIDDINELLLALVPAQAPSLDNIDGNSLVTANLSFGSSNGIAGYVNVGASPSINGAVDINGTFSSTGTRLGAGAPTVISGTLNSDVAGNLGGSLIPFDNGAFANSGGTLYMELNGSIVPNSILNLSSSSSALSNAYFNVSQARFVKFDSGVDFTQFTYRTGTYDVPTADLQLGWNYVRIFHTGSTFNTVTNYLEWVNDDTSDGSDPLSFTPASFVFTPDVGTNQISGVHYNTGGRVDFSGTASNVYRNVYSNSNTAISFPSRLNLGNVTAAGGNMDITNTGAQAFINERTSSQLQTLPELTNLTGANGADIDLDVTLQVAPDNTNVLGNSSPLGVLQTSVQIVHPIRSNVNTSAGSLNGFLIYTQFPQAVNDNTENFLGETNRLQAADYSSIAYAVIAGGANDWDGTQHLITGNAAHNTGLLVFNGELMYPNASYLNSQYGITNTGDFRTSSISFGPSENDTDSVDYSSASGIRDYYRAFTSNNVQNQPELVFEVNAL